MSERENKNVVEILDHQKIQFFSFTLVYVVS